MADRSPFRSLCSAQTTNSGKNGDGNAYMVNDRQDHVYAYNIGNRACISFAYTDSYLRSQPNAGIVHEQRSADPTGPTTCLSNSRNAYANEIEIAHAWGLIVYSGWPQERSLVE